MQSIGPTGSGISDLGCIDPTLRRISTPLSVLEPQEIPSTKPPKYDTVPQSQAPTIPSKLNSRTSPEARRVGSSTGSGIGEWARGLAEVYGTGRGDFHRGRRARRYNYCFEQGHHQE